jgi:hypothetical protein
LSREGKAEALQSAAVALLIKYRGPEHLAVAEGLERQAMLLLRQERLVEAQASRYSIVSTNPISTESIFHRFDHSHLSGEHIPSCPHLNGKHIPSGRPITSLITSFFFSNVGGPV